MTDSMRSVRNRVGWRVRPRKRSLVADRLWARVANLVGGCVERNVWESIDE